MSGGAAVYHPTYWCHSCDMSISLPPSPTLLCPHCHSDSLEQMDTTTTTTLLPSDDNFLLTSPYLHRLIEHLTTPSPPTNSAAAIHSLPDLPVTDPTLLCPICKDPFVLNSLAKYMPCTHCYHSDCILPWLEINNSCPVCRFRLPVVEEESGRVGFVRLEELMMDDEIDLYGIRSSIRRIAETGLGRRIESASEGDLFS